MKKSVLVMFVIALISANLFAEDFSIEKFENVELENNIEMAMSTPVPGGGKILAQVGEELLTLFIKAVRKRSQYAKFTEEELELILKAEKKKFKSIYLKEAEIFINQIGLEYYDALVSLKTKIYYDEFIADANITTVAKYERINLNIMRIIKTADNVLHFDGYIKGFNEHMLNDSLLMDNIIMRIRDCSHKYYSYDDILDEKVLDLEKAYKDVISNVRAVYGFPKRTEVVNEKLKTRILTFLERTNSHKVSDRVLIEKINPRSINKYADQIGMEHAKELLNKDNVFLITEINMYDEKIFHMVSMENSILEYMFTRQKLDAGYFEPIVFRSLVDNNQITTYHRNFYKKDLPQDLFSKEDLLILFNQSQRTEGDEIKHLGILIQESSHLDSEKQFGDLFITLGKHNYPKEYGYDLYAVNIYFDEEYVSKNITNIIARDEISHELINKIEFIFVRPDGWLENVVGKVEPVNHKRITSSDISSN